MRTQGASAPSMQTKTHSKEEIRLMKRKLTQSLKRVSALNCSDKLPGYWKAAKHPRSGLKDCRDPSHGFPLLFLLALGSCFFGSRYMGTWQGTVHSTRFSWHGVKQDFSPLQKGVMEE